MGELFYGATLSPIFLGVQCIELYQIWGGHVTIIDALKFVLHVRYVASFRNQSASEATVVENQGQIQDFLIPCKKLAIFLFR